MLAAEPVRHLGRDLRNPRGDHKELLAHLRQVLLVLALLSHVPLFNPYNEIKKRKVIKNDLLHRTNSSRELLPVGDEDNE